MHRVAWSLGKLPEQAQGEGAGPIEMGRAVFRNRGGLDLVPYISSPGI